MPPLNHILLLLVATLGWASPQARADLLPEPATFDGKCACELICNGSALTYYQIQFSTTKQLGTTDAGTADLACEDTGKELRGLKTVKLDVTARQATFHFCKYGGKDVAACSVDGACSEDKVTCFNATLSRNLP